MKYLYEIDEIIEELLESSQFPQVISYFSQLSNIINKNDYSYSFYVRFLSLCLAIIRRMASVSKFRIKTQEKYFGFVMDGLNRMENEIENKNEETSFFFKELSAVLGIFSLDNNIVNDLINKNVSSCLLKIALIHFDGAKLVKTILGFLTNFATSGF